MFFSLLSQSLAAPLCQEIYQEAPLALQSLPVLDGQFRLFFDHKPDAKDKNPLVFINGFSLSFEHSKPLDFFVSRMGRKMVRVDLIGVGHSLKEQIERGQPVSEITLDMQARALIELLESFGSRKVRLVGHSYGGPVTALVAKLRPDLVDRLILVSPYLKDLPLLDPSLRNLQHFSNFFGAFSPWWKAGADMIRSSYLSNSFKGVMPQVLRENKEEYNRALFELSEGIRDLDMADILKKMQVKTDILYGSLDTFIPGKEFQRAYDSLPAEQRGRFMYLENKHDLVGYVPGEVADFMVND